MTGNTLTCVKNSRVDKPVNPLTSVNVTFASIGNNVIKASDYHGMELAYSAIAEITGKPYRRRGSGRHFARGRVGGHGKHNR